MTFQFLGPDPIETQLREVLSALAAGHAPRDIELLNVDVKEEPARRDSHGGVLPGERQNDAAARYFAGELACLANTPGAGALIVGIADDGTRIGTNLDAQWLRHRVYRLSAQRLTVDINEVDLDGTRLLVLRAPEAIEPIRWKGRILWRVDDHCVEVDAATWMAGRLHRSGFDWSAQPSGHRIQDIRPSAIEAARRYLTEARNDPGAQALSSATDTDLLRRLNVVDGNDVLTNAGALLFVTTPSAAIDYIRRDYPGASSTVRIREEGPLLTQLAAVEIAALASNRTVHVPSGLVQGQVRAIPPSAVREAIVNGVIHRDWASPAPTVVEHVGDTLTVTSPGGFIGGISPANIITHPSAPRYRCLAEATAALRLAEREGIGVDRMVADMLALGHRAVEIAELTGPYVRTVLLGGDPDQDWTEFLADCEPATLGKDLDMLLMLDQLVHRGWIDAEHAAPVIQRGISETNAAIDRLANARYRGHAIVAPIAGVPDSNPPAWRLSDSVRTRLRPRLTSLLTGPGRTTMILDWAHARGRVSTTEVADLANVAQNYAGKLLGSLERNGDLVPGRPNRAGRGFFFRPVTAESPDD